MRPGFRDRLKLARSVQGDCSSNPVFYLMEAFVEYVDLRMYDKTCFMCIRVRGRGSINEILFCRVVFHNKAEFPLVRMLGRPVLKRLSSAFIRVSQTSRFVFPTSRSCRSSSPSPPSGSLLGALRARFPKFIKRVWVKGPDSPSTSIGNRLPD